MVIFKSLKEMKKKYIRKASKKTGLKRLSRSDFPAAHRTISSLSFLNLLILNKTDKKRQIGIVIISIFGNNSNMQEIYEIKDTLSEVNSSICLSP